MKSSWLRIGTSPTISRTCLLAAIPFALTAPLLVGCGGGAGQGTTFSGNTQVTILATGTANDRWTYFDAGITTLTLTSQSGNKVNLLQTAAGDDFMHMNGTIEPLTTVSVPSGVYTSATASLNGVGFVCVTTNSDGGITDPTFSYAVPVPATNVTVALPKPITISGTGMGLLLDLDVFKTLTFPPGCDGGLIPYSVTPAFVLTSMAIPGQATSSANGKMLDLMGMVDSINSDGSGFIVRAPSWIYTNVKASASTAFQGIKDLSQLTVGMPVDIDGAIQADGSITASRLAVYDTNTANLSLDIEPLLFTNMTWPGLSSSQHLLATQGAEASQGQIPSMSHYPYWDYTNAVFQTAAALGNLASLPFSASFSASTMVAGQRVMVTTHLPSIPQQDPYGNPQPAATTVTLIPQVINGMVSDVSTEGAFTQYIVTLASYDISPTFAGLHQVSALTDPDTVVVYADSNTQMLNTNPIAAGSVVRFYGLVFNDNGTLRMDCAQINDGVAE